MKTLYLKEHDVEELVSVPEVIDALDAAFRDQAAGRAWTNPRNRLRLPGSTLHMMAGAIPGYFGYKAYTVAAGKTQFFFFLYSAQTSEMLAMIEADTLGQRRTGEPVGLGVALDVSVDARGEVARDLLVAANQLAGVGAVLRAHPGHAGGIHGVNR